MKGLGCKQREILHFSKFQGEVTIVLKLLKIQLIDDIIGTYILTMIDQN